MSRHILAGKDENHEVVVGYDRPLDCYFSHVYNLKADEDEDNVVFSVWKANSVDEVLTLTEPYIKEVPKDLPEILWSESVGLLETNIVKDWRENGAAQTS